MWLDLIKTAPQYLIPKIKLTVFAGLVAGLKNRRLKNFIILRFIKKYQVNMREALVEDPTAYACFNDFFIRHLKPTCRPIAQAGIVSPVDGCISEIGRINEGQLIQAKGKYYTVDELLACEKSVAQEYVHGQFATLYLSPKDYHRVHMPVDGVLVSMTYIPGSLFSVQPAAVKVIPKLFSRNERLVLFFETQHGPMVVVFVGATIVGAIGTSWHGELQRGASPVSFNYDKMAIKQGEELGYFKLGSTVILLFANGNALQWNESLKAGGSIRFGGAMGEFK